MSIGESKAGQLNYMNIEVRRNGNSKLNKDITNIVTELNLYEDIGFGYITGNVVIEDGDNFIDQFKLTGDEFVKVEISVGSKQVTLKQFWDVVSISHRNRKSDAREAWVLNFQSFGTKKSGSTTISKSYMDNKPEKIVEDIIENHIVHPNAFEYHAAHSNLSCIIPNLNPIDAIKYIASNTVTEENVSDFFYYETIDMKSHFKSIGELMRKKSTHTFSLLNKEPDNLEEETLNIQTIGYEKEVFNSVREISQGFYASKVISFDLRKKQLNQVNTFSHKDSWDKDKNTEDHLPYYDVPMMFDDVAKTDKSNSKVSILSGTTNNHKQDQEINFEKIKTKGYRDSLLSSFNSQVVTISVPGDTSIRVGTCINLKIPTTSETRMKSENDIIDTYTSGKYFILKTRQQISAGKNNTIVTAVRNGSRVKL